MLRIFAIFFIHVVIMVMMMVIFMVVVVMVFLFFQNHVGISGSDALLFHLRNFQMPSIYMELCKLLLQIFQWHPQIQTSTQGHVPADTGEAFYI